MEKGYPVLLSCDPMVDSLHPHIGNIDIVFKWSGEMDGYYLALQPITCKWEDDQPTLSSQAVELPVRSEKARLFSFRATVALCSGRTDFTVNLHDMDGKIVEFMDNYGDVVRRKAIAVVNGRLVNDYR